MRRQAGFTLIEFSICSLATMVILGGAFTLMTGLFRSNAVMSTMMSTQSNVRVAMNTIARDITMAGTGLPVGTVAVPNGVNSLAIIRPGMGGIGAPDRNLETPGNIVPIVSTGSNDGPTTSIDTDVLTVFTIDQQTPTWSVTGVQVFTNQYLVTFSQDVFSGTTALVVGDLLLLTNNYGSVLVCVTALSAPNHFLAAFATGDQMGINQPTAANGNLTSIKNPASSPATYPPTSAVRVSLVNYYISTSNPQHPRLMRAVNAQPAQVIGEDIENLQFSFDTWNETTATQTSNVDTTLNPNQIRSVNVAVSGRSPERQPQTTDYYRFSLVSKINVRNSTFRNRYNGS